MKKLIAIFAILFICISVNTLTAYADSYKVTANSGLNVRTSQTSNSSRIGGLKKGTIVEVISTSNGWHKINYNGRTAYICARYTTKVNTSTNTNNKTNSSTSNKTNSSTGTLKITTSCNVRSAAGQYNKYLGRANYGKTYTILGSGKAPNGKLWYKIQYKSNTVGWVCSSFVKVTKTTTTTTTNSVTTQKPITTTTTKKTTTSTNMPTTTKTTTTKKTTTTTTSNLKYMGKFELTAYCHCRTCNGKWAYKPTKSGTMPKEGRTIAVDPNVIPLGTKVYINGHMYIAEDTGSAIKGKKIDVFLNSHADTKKFGRKYNVEVYIER